MFAQPSTSSTFKRAACMGTVLETPSSAFAALVCRISDLHMFVSHGKLEPDNAAMSVAAWAFCRLPAEVRSDGALSSLYWLAA